MRQLIAIILSFILIPILIRRKFKLNTTLLSAIITLGIISGIGFISLINIVKGVFLDSNSINTILTVIMVGILGGLMNYYGILDKVVETMLKIINNKKVILMIIPSLIGMFTIPGGAILSAPFVYNIGEDLEMPKVDRAAINLIFRHVAVFVLPYNASLLLVSNSLTDINIYKFIMMNSILVASILITGYLLFLREVEVESKGSDENIVKNLFNLIILTSPIYSSVIINTLFGIPFYIGVGFSILIVYLLGNKSGFLKVIKESINWDTIITIVLILIMKDLILNMEDMLRLIEGVFF